MTSKGKEGSTAKGCGCLMLFVIGLLGMAWIWGTVKNRLNPEGLKQRAAIESCNRRLADEFMPGLSGLNSSTSATVAKQAGNIYMVRWPFGADTWCKVEVVIIDGKADVSFLDASWRGAR